MSDQRKSDRRRLWNAAVRLLRRQHEGQVLIAEVIQLTERLLAADDHQRPRHVVEAVAVFATRARSLGVLVQPARVGERAQVRVPRGRDVDPPTSCTAPVTRPRPCPPRRRPCRDPPVAVGHCGPQQLGRLPRSVLGHVVGEAGFAEHPAQRRFERRGVALRHHEPGSVAQQLDRVGKGSGDHRSPGGDGLDEHPGRHLLA